jgi:hypothetical protein
MFVRRVSSAVDSSCSGTAEQSTPLLLRDCTIGSAAAAAAQLHRLHGVDWISS